MSKGNKIAATREWRAVAIKHPTFVGNETVLARSPAEALSKARSINWDEIEFEDANDWGEVEQMSVVDSNGVEYYDGDEPPPDHAPAVLASLGFIHATEKDDAAVRWYDERRRVIVWQDVGDQSVDPSAPFIVVGYDPDTESTLDDATECYHLRDVVTALLARESAATAQLMTRLDDEVRATRRQHKRRPLDEGRPGSLVDSDIKEGDQ